MKKNFCVGMLLLVCAVGCKQPDEGPVREAVVANSVSPSVAAEGVVTLTDATFDTQVLSARGAVLVDFYADWCPPCRRQGPVIKALAEELAGKAVVGKVNVDQNKRLSSTYGIRSIQTLLIFVDGALAERMAGLHSREQLLQKLQGHLR